MKSTGNNLEGSIPFTRSNIRAQLGRSNVTGKGSGVLIGNAEDTLTIVYGWYGASAKHLAMNAETGLERWS